MITYSATLDVPAETATLLTELLVAERLRRGTGVGGEDLHVGVLAKPPQYQDRLGAGRGGAGADGRAAAQSFGDQQAGQQRGGFGGDVERGRVGDHVGSSWCGSFP